jgi:hypothetical protein
MKPVHHTNNFATRDDIANVRADIASLRSLIEQALTIMPPRTSLTVAEASVLALRCEQTITGWCRHDHIGTLVRGRWAVDKAQLKNLLIDRYGEARLPPGLR